MFGGGFKASKLKAQLQLSGSRIKVIRTKKQNQLVHKQRDIAQLLVSGQEHRARIRVEDLLREENTVAAYDILELYCELLVTRMPIIESQRTCPPDLKEAVASILFAAPRSADLPELLEARKMLMLKYGKDFVIAADELRPECGVSKMIINRLSVRTPAAEEKLERLQRVAKDQGVEWDSTLYGKEIHDASLAYADVPPLPVEMTQPPPEMAQQHGFKSALADATVAAVAAHALGKHFEDADVPAPPPPFQPNDPSAPGLPTEKLVGPTDYDRAWEGPPGAAHFAAGATVAGTPPPPHLAAANPLDYPPAPTYRDGKVLPKDPMDYAPSAAAGGAPNAYHDPARQGAVPFYAPGRADANSDFPSVPKRPPSQGPGGGQGSLASATPGLTPGPGLGAQGDSFSHTAAFQQKRREREEQMRAIMEAGDRAKAAAQRAEQAAGLANAEPCPTGTGKPASQEAGGPASDKSSSELPTPPRGFAGASAFDDFMAHGGNSGGSEGDIGLPSAPTDWGSSGGKADVQRHPPVLPPPPPGLFDAPAAPGAPAFGDFGRPSADGDESGPLPGLEDLKARFEKLRQISADKGTVSGY